MESSWDNSRQTNLRTVYVNAGELESELAQVDAVLSTRPSPTAEIDRVTCDTKS